MYPYGKSVQRYKNSKTAADFHNKKFLRASTGTTLHAAPPERDTVIASNKKNNGEVLILFVYLPPVKNNRITVLTTETLLK